MNDNSIQHCLFDLKGLSACIYMYLLVHEYMLCLHEHKFITVQTYIYL